MIAGHNEAKKNFHFDGSKSAANTDTASSTPMKTNGDTEDFDLLNTKAPPKMAKFHKTARYRHRSLMLFSTQQPSLS